MCSDKALQGESPMYINDLLIRNKSVYGRETRHDQFNFVCPKFRQNTEAGRSFSVSSIKLWNSLPDDYIDIDNVEALPAVNISLYC